MSLSQAIQDLQAIGRSTAISVAYVTEPKHRKTGNPFYNSVSKEWKIEKVGQYNGLTGVSYQNSVNNQLAREESVPDFTSGPIWGGKGQHVDQFLVQHKENGKQYLKVLPTGNIQVQYRFVDTKLPLNADELQLLSLFAANKPEHTGQGTEKEVKWNLIELSNLIQMTFNHNTYSMEQ